MESFVILILLVTMFYGTTQAQTTDFSTETGSGDIDQVPDSNATASQNHEMQSQTTGNTITERQNILSSTNSVQTTEHSTQTTTQSATDKETTLSKDITTDSTVTNDITTSPMGATTVSEDITTNQIATTTVSKDYTTVYDAIKLTSGTTTIQTPVTTEINVKSTETTHQYESTKSDFVSMETHPETTPSSSVLETKTSNEGVLGTERTTLSSKYTSPDHSTHESTVMLDQNSTSPVSVEVPSSTRDTGNTSTSHTILNNENTAQEDNDTVLFVVLPVLFVTIAVLVSISLICLYRNRKKARGEKAITYRRNPENPAFMTQNTLTTAHQMNSRDSMMPKATKVKLRDSSFDGFEDVDLREENDFFPQNKPGINNGPNLDLQLSELSSNSSTEDNSRSLLKQETTFMTTRDTDDSSKTLPMKSSFKPSKTNKSTSKSTESIPPLPEKKGHDFDTEQSNKRLSHYDCLPLRESLPVKQRKHSARDVLNIIAPGNRNPEYDVLPLKTFGRNDTETDHAGELSLTMTSSNPDLHSSGTCLNETSVDLSNSMDNVFQATNANELSTDIDSSENELSEEMAPHDTIKKMRNREPANRAPSFVVLPRAPSGSLRTAL